MSDELERIGFVRVPAIPPTGQPQGALYIKAGEQVAYLCLDGGDRVIGIDVEQLLAALIGRGH